MTATAEVSRPLKRNAAGWYEHPTRAIELPSFHKIKEALAAPGLAKWDKGCSIEFLVDMGPELRDTLEREELIELATGASWRKSSPARKTGTAAHKVIERLVRGEKVTRTDENGWVLDVWQAFVDEFAVEVVETEAVVWNEKVGYAGRADLLLSLKIDGRRQLSMFDAKTGASGIWPETVLQTTAYAMAPTILRPDGTEEDMPEIDSCAALWIRPEGFAVRPLQFDRDTRTAVRALAALWRWDYQISRGSVRPAINKTPITR